MHSNERIKKSMTSATGKEKLIKMKKDTDLWYRISQNTLFPYIDNFYTSVKLYQDLLKCQAHVCGTVKVNGREGKYMHSKLNLEFI